MNADLALACVVTVGICGLISLAMILRFLWLVFERGGPTALRTAAAAVRQVYDPNWAAKLTRNLRSSLSAETEGGKDADASK